MSDLVAFLRARLDDDEQMARSTIATDWLEESRWIPGIAEEDVLHMARWKPARVLAEVDAKRRIVDWVVRAAQVTEEDCYNLGVEDVLRLLALPFASHEEYRDEWRP